MSQTPPDGRRIAYFIEVDPETIRMWPDILLEDGRPRRFKIEPMEAFVVPGRVVAIDMDTMERTYVELTAAETADVE